SVSLRACRSESTRYFCRSSVRQAISACRRATCRSIVVTAGGSRPSRRHARRSSLSERGPFVEARIVQQVVTRRAFRLRRGCLHCRLRGHLRVLRPVWFRYGLRESALTLSLL